MTTVVQTVPFAKLVAVDAINARAATKEDLDTLADSIAAKGLIQALSVRPADGDRFEIIDGRRRYQALAKLVKAKLWKKDDPVPVLVRNEDDAEALETSLMANTVRLPMHPVDQHQVFARLADAGVATAEIAARFGIVEKTVRQHLALGRLAEPVRAAWRKGRIDAETAQAFAIHPDAAVQAAAFEKLSKRKHYGSWAYAVRNEFAVSRERADQSDELAFVGEAAYLAAGGTIEEDLFSDARYVTDVPLAKKLAHDKLKAECDRLVKKDGWAWAEIADEAGFDDWRCMHVHDTADEKIDDATKDRDYSKADKKKSGCLVRIGWKGKIEVQRGLLKPEPRQTDIEDGDDDAGEPGELPSARAFADTPAAEPEPAGPYDITQALAVSVHEALTIAAAQVLRADPLVALQVLVAQLECSTSNGPVKITDAGNAVVSDRHKRDHRKTFAKRLPQVTGAQAGPLLVTLAARVAQSLSMVPSGHGVYNATFTEAGQVAALRDFLPGAEYLDAIRQAFNASDYFARASKATALAAIEELREAGCFAGAVVSSAKGLEAMKKAELVTFAAERAKRFGWLPPELRHPDYELIAPERRLTGKMAAAEQTGEDTAPARGKQRRARA